MKSDLAIRTFKSGYEALGLVTDFLAAEPPFDRFKANKLLTTIKYQLQLGQHVAGFEKERLVAYCGWLTTSKAVGEAWLLSNSELKYIPPTEADAVALTVVRVLRPEHVLPMMRACRERNPGQRVFFKRDYANDSQRSRKHSVANRSPKVAE